MYLADLTTLILHFSSLLILFVRKIKILLSFVSFVVINLSANFSLVCFVSYSHQSTNQGLPVLSLSVLFSVRMDGR